MFVPFFAWFNALECCGSNSAVFHVLKIRSCFLSEFSTMPSMIPCALCVHLLVSSEYPAYAVYSHILCRQKPAHGLSFFFLPASFFFLSRKKKEKCWKKNSIKFKLNIRLNQITNLKTNSPIYRRIIPTEILPHPHYTTFL